MPAAPAASLALAACGTRAAAFPNTLKPHFYAALEFPLDGWICDYPGVAGWGSVPRADLWWVEDAEE